MQERCLGILVGKRDGMRSLLSPGRRWEDNVTAYSCEHANDKSERIK